MTSDQENKGGWEIPKGLVDVSSYLQMPPNPAARTNKLLSEHKTVAELQLEFLKESSVKSSATAARALRLAKWANIIGVVAAFMAAIAAAPVVIELYLKYVAH